MAYVDTIQSFKDAISGYSAEEKRLTELYKSARQKNEEAKKQSLELLDSSYKSDRNDAYSDNARDERNTMRVLASRGLGFSGEAAQARLNSDLALSSRLGDLAAENAKQRLEIINQSDDIAQSLSLEEAEKLSDISRDKSKLLYDLTKTQAELEAKYENSQDININGSNGQDPSGGSGALEGEKVGDGYFNPEIKPKDLAKLAVLNATGGEYIKTEDDAYRLNKYLLALYENHDLSKEYKEELVFMLKAYGYNELSDADLKLSVVTQDGRLLYDDVYIKNYKSFLDRGANPSAATVFARSKAVDDVMDMLYERSDSKEEFMKYCKALGFKDSTATTYASNRVWYTPKPKAVKRKVNVKRPNDETTK